MDFEEQVNAAFGDALNAQPPTQPPLPDNMGHEQPLPGNMGHEQPIGVEPPPVKKKKSKKKRDRDPNEPPREKKRKTFQPTEELLEESRELYDQIVRFAEAFPECADNVEVYPDMPPDELRFILAKIQRKINAKNELAVLRSGLIAGCIGVEMASQFIPKNPIKLHGFSNDVNANISAFDTCLKQILCKHGDKFALSVEATLGLLLLKHAASTHMANMTREAKEKKEADEKITIPPIPPPIEEVVEPPQPPLPTPETQTSAPPQTPQTSEA